MWAALYTLKLSHQRKCLSTGFVLHIHLDERPLKNTDKKVAAPSEMTWRVIGWAYCRSHPKLADQTSSLLAEQVSNSATLPTGVSHDSRRSSLPPSEPQCAAEFNDTPVESREKPSSAVLCSSFNEFYRNFGPVLIKPLLLQTISAFQDGCGRI